MKKAHFPRSRGSLGALFLAAAMIAGLAETAGQTGPILRLAHYSTGNGMAGFILDRVGSPVKLRLDGSDEIVALTAVPAQEGAISLKRDDGKVLVRLDDQRHVIFFGELFRDGTPVFIDQEATPLVIASATKTQAEDKAAATMRHLKSDLGIAVQIDLEAPAVESQSLKWSAMADAVVVVDIAFKDLAATQLGHDAIAAKIDHIVIRDTTPSAIELSGKTLVLSIAADKPVTGRPSSALLESKLGDLL